MRYLLAILVAFMTVAVLTPLISKLAMRLGVVDVPSEPRKIHKNSTPLLGGLAIYLGFMAVLWCIALATPHLLATSIKLKHLIGISLGGAVLMVGGYLDDRYRLKPSRQIWFPIVAALIVIFFRISDHPYANPA